MINPLFPSLSLLFARALEEFQQIPHSTHRLRRRTRITIPGLDRLAARDKKSAPIASDQDQTVFAGTVKHLDIAGPSLRSRKNFTAWR